MEIQIVTDKKERIIECHNCIHGSMKQALEYALEAGQLLTEVKDSLNHGEFLPWIESNMPFEKSTAYNYMKLFTYRCKLPSVGNLQEAYKQIETIEKQEKESEQQKAIRRVQEYKRTGVKPEGWRRGTDDKLYQDELDYEKRMEIRRAEIEQREKERERKEDERKTFFEQTVEDIKFLDDMAEAVTEKYAKRQSFKEKIKLSQSGKDDSFIDAIMEYLEELEDDNRRIEACNNILKTVRNIANQLHHKSAEDELIRV